MQIYLPIAEMSVNLFFLMGIGAAIGFLSGLFGVGGGFLLTPLLIFSGVPAPVAVASVTGQVAAASTSGALSYWRRGAIDLQLAGFLVLGGTAGAFVGVWIFDILRSFGQLDLAISIGYLTFLGSIGTLMLIEAVRSLIRSRKSGPPPRRLPGQHNWTHGLPLRFRFKRSKLYISIIPVVGIGFFIGIVGSLLGIGGGFILVPALVYLLRVPGSVVIGTSLLHVLAVMAATCVLHAIQSQSVDILLAFCLMVGSVAGAQFGVSAGQFLRGDQLRALLALIVLGVAIRFALTLFLSPADPFSMATLGFGEAL